ncbi:MAG: threonine/serine dehydratase [Thermoleophilia bacterium]|nr:threonine/serine dehydratase [Thermoleophilia bacterium]
MRRPRPRAWARHRGRLLIPLAAIEAARERISDVAIRTPLVRLQAPESPAEIWLKLECLQPIGSFKIRGAANAIRSAPPGAIDGGVFTTSAGNMAQGVAWIAREEGVPATVVAPEHAPQTKLDAIARLGGTVIKIPYETWWETMENGAYPGVAGYFVHPVLDDAVMAGNGTIGLELVEDLDEIDTVLVPWGGGGLTTGIASALAALSPRSKVVACEPETGAPFAASLSAGEPVGVEYTASFVDGAGSKALLPAMWARARPLVSGAVTLTLEETAGAIRLLSDRASVIAEGAGALSVAAALSGRAGAGKIVCIVSGGNIDPPRLAAILEGRTPD